MSLFKSKFFIGALVAVAFVFAGSANAAYMHSVTLKMGMSNASVMSLQQTLNMTSCKVAVTGAGSMGNETMYFGGLTLGAVKCFQVANGLVADGIVGPMTAAKLMAVTVGNPTQPGCPAGALYNSINGAPCTSTSNFPAGCTSAAGYSPTTGVKCDSNPSTPTPNTDGPLKGGAGSITVEGTSDFTSEEVGEGEEEVEILGFEIEADDESDVEITSVKVELVQGTAADSEDLTDYAETVYIMMNGEVVGEADAEDFSENSDIWTKSISLDDAIVRMGETEEFSVAITALNNLDSGDIDTDAWTVDVLNVRFEDADGVVTTEDTDADSLEQSFDFADFASSADLEVKISLSDEDDVNDAHVLNVDASDDTDDVEVLSFDVEADGDSDIVIDEVPVVVTTVGMNVLDGISRVTLWADGEELDSIATEDDDTSDSLVFTDLDFTIDAGDTVTFTVTVDINDLDATAGSEVAEGDTIQVSVGADADWDIEDESGEAVGTADITGTAAGDAHAIYDVGFNLELVSATETVQTNDTTADVGTFVIKYKVTAFDGDIYLDNTCVEDNDGSEVATATSYSVTNNGSNTSSCVTTSTGDTDGGTAFLIEEGTSETITLTVSVVPTADSFAQVKLEAIGWDDAAGGDDNVFDFNLPGDFETDPIFLNFTA